MFQITLNSINLLKVHFLKSSLPFYASRPYLPRRHSAVIFLPCSTGTQDISWNGVWKLKRRNINDSPITRKTWDFSRNTNALTNLTPP